MSDDQPALLSEESYKKVWTAVYLRWGAKGEEEFASLREAYEYLHWGADEGNLLQYSIITPNGVTIDVRPFSGDYTIWDDFEEFKRKVTG